MLIACSEHSTGRQAGPDPMNFEFCWAIILPLLLFMFWHIFPSCCFFFPLVGSLFILSMQDRRKSRTLKVGVGKSENTDKSRRKSPTKDHPVLKTPGVTRSKSAVRTLYACPKSQKYAHGIIHNGAAKGHTAVIDAGSQQSMVIIGGWDIIKRHDTWIDTQGVNMGGSSKAGHRLKLVDTRGVIKNCLDGKRYLITFRQYLFHPKFRQDPVGGRKN